MHRIGLILVLIVFSLGSAAPTEAAKKYELIILEPLNGYIGSSAMGINKQGEVVGKAGYGPSRPVYWNPANNYVPTDIGTFGGANGEARGINDGSYVVGQADDATGKPCPFLWDPATEQLRNLVGLNGATYNTGQAINIHGQIVGYSFTDRARACLFGLNQPTVDISGGHQSWANGINDSGQVAGTRQVDETIESDEHPALRQNGAWQDLDPGGQGGAAVAINNSGQVVGSLKTYNSEGFTANRAFIWSSPTGRQVIPLLPNRGNNLCNGLNNLGQVVGVCYNYSESDYVPFLWAAGQEIVALNSLIPESGFTLTEATGINDKGEIIGWGVTADSQKRAFLLRPKTGVTVTTAGIVNLLLN